MFISLHNHTQWSILDSTVRIKNLFTRAKELNQNAIAITDHATTVAGLDALKESRSSGIKLIIGSEVYFRNNPADNDEQFKHIILLAKNAIGYKNLLTLQAKGYDNIEQVSKKCYSVLDWKLLENHSEGLICLTSCGNGIVAQHIMNKDFDAAEKVALRLKSIFGDNLGLEIQANNLKRMSKTFYSNKVEQAFINRQLILMGKKLGIKVVPTCNTHYVKKEDAEDHDIQLAIGSGQSIYSNFRLKYEDKEFYLKSEEEMFNFFSRNYDEEFVRAIIANTEYFSNLCENPDWIEPKFSNPSGKELPDFPVKDQDDYNEFLTWSGKQEDNVRFLEEDHQYMMYKCFMSDKYLPEYKERFDKEFDVLTSRGFSSYMLVVSDFLKYCDANSIPRGPGRGSVGGCLIAYLLDIHKANPIKYDFIFERFQNKFKQSMPDIDSDVSTSGRDTLIKYLSNKYGEEHVAHVSNYNRITPKVYARDLCRALELGGADNCTEIGTAIADSIPSEITSIKQALKDSPLFAEYAKQYPQLEKHITLDGLIRSNATHAGGIIVSKRPLVGLVPYRKEKDGTAAIEFEKERTEEIGLVKIDLLGLQTLDIISKTYELIKQNGKPLPYFDYETYDEKTYKLLQSGNTFAVFQLGTSAGTMDLCRKIKPVNIEDISAINALARPSSKDIRQPYADARDGKTKVELLHPKLERAFAKTLGFGLYEESLLFLGLDISLWDLNECDKLRKLTKEKGKNPEKIKKWRQEFIDGAVKNNIKENIAIEIWDNVIAGFSGYGFNKSLVHTTYIPTYNKNGDFVETKQIKDIKPGCFVKSRDEKTNKNIFIEVKANHNHGKLKLVEILLDNGEIVRCTINHKFRVKENGKMLPLYQIIKEGLSIVVDK